MPSLWKSPMQPANDKKIYTQIDVLTAARRRIEIMFDRYQTICVSISGGKDSTVLLHLVHDEACKRSRDFHVFFLDQEAEYTATIEMVRQQMKMQHVIPHWYQVPIQMTNATSFNDEFLNAWGVGETWSREKEPDSIHHAEGAPDRFYDFMDWFEATLGEACHFVGLRSEESLNRFGAVTRNPGVDDIKWTSKAKGGVRAYPIYDWAYEDVWTYLGREKKPYNRAYDWMWALQTPITEMRVSYLLHEKSYKCLMRLQEFEPENYDAILKRVGGIRSAAKHAKSPVYTAKILPPAYKTWREYREALLAQAPAHRRETFSKRFENQADTASVHRQQVRQLLINDWENNSPVVNVTPEDPRQKWMERL